jgi:DNA-directed RNA polymerase subunit RPC12/RpoP
VICAKCEKLLVKRDGFSTTINNVKNGDCPYCGKHIVGRGMRRNGE